MSLIKTCNKAMENGKTLDLSGCFYTPAKKNSIPMYYYFLAGLIKEIEATQVLEVGTYYGGSSRAMATAMNVGGKVITLDVEGKKLLRHPQVTYVKGNSQELPIIKKVCSFFIPPIDVIYLDSVHTYIHTMNDFYSYNRLNPKYVIFDDIKLNPQMIKAWGDLSARFNALDIGSLVNRKCGFGIIQLR